MAFRTNSPLQTGFAQAIDMARQEKNYLTAWQAQLTANITALDAIAISANLERCIPTFTSVAAIPGIVAYGKAQYGDDTYDLSTEFSAMVAALTAIHNWLKTNIPAGAVTISNGQLVGVTYTPAQTSALRTLITTALTTIS